MSEQELVETGREALERWEQVDPAHVDFIAEARFRLSHGRWPKRTEGKLTFEFDYYALPTDKRELSTIVDTLRECALYAQRAARKDVPSMSLIVTQAKEMMDAKIHYLRNSRDVPARHPDSVRKWTDPKRTLYDGTRVWNDDGTPALMSLCEARAKFMAHGDGGESVHEFRAFVQTMRDYQHGQVKKTERQRPPKNRERTKEEVAEALALKESQRVESRRRREALDADEDVQFHEALKRRDAAVRR